MATLLQIMPRTRGRRNGAFGSWPDGRPRKSMSEIGTAYLREERVSIASTWLRDESGPSLYTNPYERFSNEIASTRMELKSGALPM